MRSTGLGWALGVGRVGFIVGLNHSAGSRSCNGFGCEARVYLVCIVPALVGAAAVASSPRRAAASSSQRGAPLRRDVWVAVELVVIKMGFKRIATEEPFRHARQRGGVPRTARAPRARKASASDSSIGYDRNNPSERTRLVAERLRIWGAAPRRHDRDRHSDANLSSPRRACRSSTRARPCRSRVRRTTSSPWESLRAPEALRGSLAAWRRRIRGRPPKSSNAACRRSG